jgi:integrase
MASYRQRTGSTWEVVVKRKNLGGKGYVSETFATRELGQAWASRLEALLDAGIVPDEYKEGAERVNLLGQLIRNYENKNFIPQSDRELLDSIQRSVGDTHVNAIDLAWVERWIQDMKVARNNSPVTIRHYVGALRRCFDWASKQPVAALLINPIRILSTRYALYSPEDIKLGEKADKDFEAREDVERDRRLTPAEMVRIRRVMNQENLGKRQRPVQMEWQGATELMWSLGMETAMRMREMYTLNIDQIDLAQRTIFLSKTKNGDTRQVPLSSEALKLIQCYMEQVRTGTRKMEGFSFDEGRLFL